MKKMVAGCYVIVVTVPRRGVNAGLDRIRDARGDGGDQERTAYLAGDGWSGDYLVDGIAEAKSYKTQKGAEKKIATMTAQPMTIDGTPYTGETKWTGYSFRVEKTR
jgi:hypothetical protein